MSCLNGHRATHNAYLLDQSRIFNNNMPAGGRVSAWFACCGVFLRAIIRIFLMRHLWDSRYAPSPDVYPIVICTAVCACQISGTNRPSHVTRRCDVQIPSSRGPTLPDFFILMTSHCSNLRDGVSSAHERRTPKRGVFFFCNTR